MNPKDIGKKDWEIKQEFLKSNPMSQEEEKLIEELEEYKWYYYLNELSPGNVGEMLIFINKKINEAYRAGKLAGFEVCEKLLINEERRLERIRFENKDYTSLFGESRMATIKDLKSLIEEENKKL